MNKRVRTRAQSLSLALILLAPPHLAAAPGGTPPPAPGPLYARDPDVDASAILFVSGDDLWTVPRDGGVARRVAAGAGPKRRPKLSPDGAMIAFTGRHGALYTVPAAGGEPSRVTHHPGATDLCDWTADGRLLFMTDGFMHLFDGDGEARIRQLFTVAASGGLPSRLPLPYGANGALAGEWLAYTYYAEGRAEARGRHLGGNAPDVWLFNLRTRASRKITEWEGTDTAPMWHGRTVYYLSDAGSERRLNLWSFDTTDGKRRQLTRYADFDVKWPSVGPGPRGAGEIVFSHGTRLALLDLATGEARDVEVRLPAAAAAPAEQTFDAAKHVQRFAPAPDGSRAALEARGDVWVVGGPGVAPRNLTHSAAAAERDPAWSPDGRWVAYFSDASGEYELWVTPADGSPGARRLSEIGPGLRYRPAWSPDSRSIAFSDSAGALYLASLASGRTIRFDVDPLGRRPRLAWSPDSAWIAYSRGIEGSTRSRAIWLYDVAAGSARQATSGWYSDDSPVFDRAGEYLYFVSARNQWDSMVFDSADDGNFAYPSADLVMAVPLRRGITSPWSPRTGQRVAPAARAGERISIDFESFEEFEHRGVAILEDAGDYGNLAVAADGRLLYTFQPPSGATSIRFADFEKGRAKNAPETATVLEGVDAFELAADGRRLLARSGETLAFVDAAASQKLEPALELSGMTVRPDPRAEWGQLFRDAWRRARDLFYDPTMRGVDWAAMRAKYEPLLAACHSREDAYTVIRDLLSELGSSHTKVAPPSDEEPENTGVLGVDFELVNGAYRIAKIHDGPATDHLARNPLRRPGVEVSSGEYLLAVDGKPLDPKVDPWAPFVGLASKPVTITVGPHPRIDAAARRVVVTPRRSEPFVRNRAWVEANRVAVEQASGGRVGYVYLATTETYGSAEFTRQLAGQLDKEALVVDVRWNEGGFWPFRVVDVLARQRYLYVTEFRRAAGGGRLPDYLLEGPSCLLINEISLSGGDALPYFYRKRGVGKLVGSRTFGGFVGVWLTPFLVDGGELRVPHEGSYESSDAWAIEGHGVEPDVVVRETPTELAEGHDPQLEAAVRLLLKELDGRQRPPRPRPPGQ